jgi:hypothetical protein
VRVRVEGGRGWGVGFARPPRVEHRESGKLRRRPREVSCRARASAALLLGGPAPPHACAPLRARWVPERCVCVCVCVCVRACVCMCVVLGAALCSDIEWGGECGGDLKLRLRVEREEASLRGLPLGRPSVAWRPQSQSLRRCSACVRPADGRRPRRAIPCDAVPPCRSA